MIPYGIGFGSFVGGVQVGLAVGGGRAGLAIWLRILYVFRTERF